MYNKVILQGNLSKDIELKYLPSGSALANTSIATNRKFKKQDGTQGEEVCFIDIVFFGRTAEIVNQYLKKGSKVLIDGRLKLEQWSAQDGTNRSKHTVVVENLTMLDTKENNTQQSTPKREPEVVYEKQNVPEIDIDDEIPF